MPDDIKKFLSSIKILSLEGRIRILELNQDKIIDKLNKLQKEVIEMKGKKMPMKEYPKGKDMPMKKDMGKGKGKCM